MCYWQWDKLWIVNITYIIPNLLIILIIAFQNDENSFFIYLCILCFPFQKDESVIKMFRAAKRFRKRLTLTRHKSRHNAFTFYTKYESLLWWIDNFGMMNTEHCWKDISKMWSSVTGQWTLLFCLMPVAGLQNIV